MLHYPTKSGRTRDKGTPSDLPASNLPASRTGQRPDAPAPTAPVVHSLQGQPQPSSSSAQSGSLIPPQPPDEPFPASSLASSALTLSARQPCGANASGVASTQPQPGHAPASDAPLAALASALAGTGLANASDSDEDSAHSGQQPQEANSSHDAKPSADAFADLLHETDGCVSLGRYGHALRMIAGIPAAQRTPTIQGYLAALCNAKSGHAWRKAERERYAAAAEELKPLIEANGEAAQAYTHVMSNASSDPKLLVQIVLTSKNEEDVKLACQKLAGQRHVELTDIVACANKAYAHRFDRLAALLYKKAGRLHKKRGEALAPMEFARYAYCASSSKRFHGSDDPPVKYFQRIIDQTSWNAPMHVWAEHELAVMHHRYCVHGRNFLLHPDEFQYHQRKAIEHYDNASRGARRATQPDQLMIEVSRCSTANAEKVRALKGKTVESPVKEEDVTLVLERAFKLVGDCTPPESIPAP